MKCRGVHARYPRQQDSSANRWMRSSSGLEASMGEMAILTQLGSMNAAEKRDLYLKFAESELQASMRRTWAGGQTAHAARANAAATLALAFTQEVRESSP